MQGSGPMPLRTIALCLRRLGQAGEPPALEFVVAAFRHGAQRQAGQLAGLVQPTRRKCSCRVPKGPYSAGSTLALGCDTIFGRARSALRLNRFASASFSLHILQAKA